MNRLTLITCFAVVLSAASANSSGEEDRQMVHVGMMDGFIVLDEDVINSNQSKFTQPIPLTNPKLPESITGSRPEKPEESITTSRPKLPGRPIRPTTIKLPPLLYGPHPFQSRPYPYPYGSLTAYGPKPYTAPGGYGSQIGYGNQYSYGFRPSYSMLPPGPDDGFRPAYAMLPSRPSYGFRPNYPALPPRPSYGFQPSYPALPSRPIYGFQPYEKDEISANDQDAMLRYADSD